MAVKTLATKTFQGRSERRRGITYVKIYILSSENIPLKIIYSLFYIFRDRPIRFRCFLQNTIYDVLKNRGWIESRE